MNQSKSYSIKNRVWIQSDYGTFLGEGRIALLKEIEKHGSIAKAANSMKMSYKKAWALVNSMNEQSKVPLVHRMVGGTGGGGSQLSDQGKKVIEIFTKLQEETTLYLKEKAKELDF